MEPGYEPLKIDVFGGLSTLSQPTDIPAFMSPDCQDVEFVPGTVQTRPGLDLIFTGAFTGAAINYLKTYQAQSIIDAIQTMFMDSLGNVQKRDELTQVLSTIQAGLLPNIFCNSVTQFGREYMAMGDGKYGLDLPRQYDNTNFDRVSQVGPGAAPVAVDEAAAQFAIAASPAGLQVGTTNLAIITASQAGSTVTLVFGGPTLIDSTYVGTGLRVSGVSQAGYNGDWTISAVFDSGQRISYDAGGATGLAPGTGGQALILEALVNLTVPYTIPSNLMFSITGATNAVWDGTYTILGQVAGASVTTFFFQVDGPTFDALQTAGSSGGGFVFSAGNIVAGVHQVTVIFETRQGYLTRPAPPSSWTAQGGLRVTVSKIPTGPDNVIARRLLFTAAGGDVFYSQDATTIIPTGDMRIPDNSTTTVTVDFSEASLLESENLDYLFDLIELGECSNVTEYSSRMVWTGEANNIQNFLNLTFDGGFTPRNAGFVPNLNLPLGWKTDFGYAGGSIAPSAVWGQAYSITGDGSGTNGRIFQTAYQDYLGDAILQPNTAYLIKARLQKLGTGAGATVIINISTGTGAFADTGMNQPVQPLSDTAYGLYSAQTVVLPATIPPDTQLTVEVSGLLLGEQVFIDNITIVPLKNPVNQSIARVSLVEDPESYNGVSGFLQPAEGAGQALNGAFRIRDYLYLWKDHSLFVTSDDGQNEPAGWEISEVSSQVGSPSPRGVGIGDEWAVIGAQSGLWYFTGSTFSPASKLSQEIQPTWDAIDWSNGQLLDIKVDTTRKRIYINAPTSATGRKLLTLDYTEGFGDPAANEGVGRKWAPWVVNANSMNKILLNDLSYQFMFGDAELTSSVYGLNPQQFLDVRPDTKGFGGLPITVAPRPINSYWQSGYFTGDGRINFGFIEANLQGVGTCDLIGKKGDQLWVANIRPWQLSTLGFGNLERKINVTGVRFSIRFGTDALAEHFSLQGFTMSSKPAPFGTERGINAYT